MLTKNEIKYLRSLHQKKEREEAQCFLCEGDKIVTEALASGFLVKKVYVTHKSSEALNLDFDHVLISEKEMDQISSLNTAPGILALVEYPKNETPAVNEFRNETFLLLDGINDPGNLGTILRIADWYGIIHVFCSLNSVDRFNPKVVQSSMGSIFRTKVHYLDLNPLIEECLEENIPMYAAVMDGTPVKSSFMKNGGLIMGSESHGISRSLLLPEMKKVTIPKFGKAESLNVAVATGILLSLIQRD